MYVAWRRGGARVVRRSAGCADRELTRRLREPISLDDLDNRDQGRHGKANRRELELLVLREQTLGEVDVEEEWLLHI